MLCCVLAWMNEYIVQIISATRLWLISRYSHHTLKKSRKMTAKNGHPCTKWYSSLCLQTNRKHMEKQSLICTRKTSFYTDNITSTLTIVVFSINWLRMFTLYVCRMCCKLELKTLNNRKTTASLWNHRKTSRDFRSMHLHYTAILVFFHRSFARNLKNISRIVWYRCNIWHPYKISNIVYKTNKKTVSFFIDNIQNVTWPFPSAFIFPAAWRVFVRTHRKMCCSILQWCDVMSATQLLLWCKTLNF